MAYAELAGFPPDFGIYSSILPLVAYGMLGSSRQLIIGLTPQPARSRLRRWFR
jgi:MFS superfamily sulfate permease-like transporter